MDSYFGSGAINVDVKKDIDTVKVSAMNLTLMQLCGVKMGLYIQMKPVFPCPHGFLSMYMFAHFVSNELTKQTKSL